MSITQTLGQLDIGLSISELFAAIPDGAGVPESLPDMVPEFVGDLVSTIGGALGDAKDGLGDLITDIVGGGIDAVGMNIITETATLLGTLGI